MTGQGYDYINGSLVDYSYFKEHYKLIAINLRKQKVLKADPEYFFGYWSYCSQGKKFKKSFKIYRLKNNVNKQGDKRYESN